MNIKKKKTLPLAPIWVILKDIMLSAISQAQKDEYCRILFVPGI
jgi:hypothetical protein